MKMLATSFFLRVNLTKFEIEKFHEAPSKIYPFLYRHEYRY